MGLDLFHRKLVLKPVDTEDYLTVDQLPPDAFSVYGFDRYIRDVPDVEVLHTVRFLPDRRTYDWKIAQMHTDGYAPNTVTCFLGTPDSCEQELAALEIRLGLTRSQAWFSSCRHLDKGEWYPERFAIYSRPSTMKGVYYVEVGYQRKGMVEQFYKDYPAYVYMDHARFAALPVYLDPDARDEMLPNLLENFVRSYELGRSFLYVSK